MQYSLFKDAFEHSPTGLALLDQEGDIFCCNGAFSTLVGATPGALTGTRFRELCAFEEHHVFYDHFERLKLQDHEPFDLEIRLRKSVTDTTWVHLQARLLGETKPEPMIILSLQDATIYHEVQNSLEENLRQTRRSEKTLADLLDAIPQALLVLNDAAVILFCNHAAELLFELSQGQLLGHKLDILVPDEMDAVGTFLKTSRQHVHGKNYRTFGTQTRALLPNGSRLSVSLHLRPLGWGNASESLCILQDLSEHEELERRIEEATYFDALTGLPNRQYLRHHLGHLFRETSLGTNRATMFFCDLDRFKTLNNSLGHEIGDQIINETAQRLLATLYPNDLLCRYSGDKFVFVPEQTVTAEVAAKIAAKINQAIARPMNIKGQELFLTSSIGIAMAPDDGQDLDSLAKNAEAAMYRAKKTGGNSYNFYTRKYNDHSMDRLKLVNSLYRALENQEFFLSFQPQVNPRTFRIVGAEALLRWHYPPRGVLLPNDFIPLLEETGLIFPVGEWVLEMACKQAMRWRNLIHNDFRIAVNISARQLRDTNFADCVSRVLENTGIPAACLELEITESALLDDVEASKETLRRITDLGVHISIDDFGTGYSSFTYLKYFSAHALKLDRLFVNGLPDNQEDVSISRAICTLAKSLGMNLVAEGVENSQQLDLLKKWHCTHVQGFYFTEPLAAGPFEHWISTYR